MLEEIIRLERFCAALYKALPVEGRGLVAQAAELAHAAELEQEADRLAAEDADAVDWTALTPEDIRTACQLLIDVRRAPATRPQDELALVRTHFPEVDEPSLDALGITDWPVHELAAGRTGRRLMRALPAFHQVHSIAVAMPVRTESIDAGGGSAVYQRAAAQHVTQEQWQHLP